MRSLGRSAASASIRQTGHHAAWQQSPSPLVRATGHVRTILGEIGGAIRPPHSPRARVVGVTVDDDVMGPVELRGLFGEPADADTVVVIVPGLTGTADAPYCALAARAAERAGCAHFRIGMRGTDRTGEDIWHGGLTDDLHATLAAPALARFAHVVLVGYSVGGHVALRAVTEQRLDARVCGVAALCPPLDLDLGTHVFDEPQRRLYRRHILGALNQIYAATAARRSLPVPLEVVLRARSSRERDALAIAPRFGFASAEDYYARASVAPLLRGVRVPALVGVTRGEPSVPPRAVIPALGAAGPALTVQWADGGHLVFPLKADFGFGGAVGMENQIVSWLLRA